MRCQQGRIIGSHEVQSVLGIGGFSITYKAYNRTLERMVAVKEYLPSTLAVRTLNRTTVAPRSEGDARDYNYGLKRFLDEARRSLRCESALKAQLGLAPSDTTTGLITGIGQDGGGN